MPRSMIAFAVLLSSAPLFAQGSKAQPVGGQQAIDLLVEQDLHYPIAALEVGLKGDVIVMVHVLGDGSVTGLKVHRSLSRSVMPKPFA